MSLNRINVPQIYFGRGSLKELRNLRQKKVLVITDKIIFDLYGNKITKYLKKKEYKFFTEVEPDPKDKNIIKGAEHAREFKPDLIVGIGGGSVMDSAKGIFFLYEREDKTLYDINPLNFFKLGRKSRLVLVPTTSGTGAEHTGAIIVTNTETGQKVGLICYELVPSIVILDPNLSIGMPSQLTASTGIDAVTHAIESYINSLSNDFTDALDLHAIKLLFNYLPRAVGDGAKDILIRGKVHNAASLAGISLANTAAGIAHSCGHSLGSVLGIQHGKAVGLMLPYIIEFNKPACEEKYSEILNILDIKTNNDPTKELANAIRNLLNQIKLPTSIKDLGISEDKFNEKFEKLVEFAFTDLATSLNPRQTSKEEFTKIFQYAYQGKQIDF
ncbi:MAG: iron-containing alcohol dehydrogenase [Candidatus Helarchaeota archaeon]